jgi:hypothetical protein
VKHDYDEELLVAIKLSKAGYGRPQEILDMPLNVVLGIVQYERFIPEYEEAFIEMNKKESS